MSESKGEWKVHYHLDFVLDLLELLKGEHELAVDVIGGLRLMLLCRSPSPWTHPTKTLTPIPKASKEREREKESPAVLES